jgi:hypothetical protein
MPAIFADWQSFFSQKFSIVCRSWFALNVRLSSPLLVPLFCFVGRFLIFGRFFAVDEIFGFLVTVEPLSYGIEWTKNFSRK